MRRFILMLLLTLFAAAPCTVLCQAPAQPTATAQAASAVQKPAYSLPPEKLREAIAYSRERALLGLIASLWSIGQLWLLLATGLAARMRDLALRLSRNRWLQCAAFLFLLLVANTLLDAPLAIVSHHLALHYGQSVQSWGSWLRDHGKHDAVLGPLGVLLVMLLFWTVRRFPRRWWIWTWAFAGALTIFGAYAAPIIYDPLFHHFTPLQQTDPALVARLEQVVARTGVAIPPQRIFLMDASKKVTDINAYVTGLGPSKRFVMWDTTLTKLTPDQILFVFGHETGHYVLHHVAQGILFALVVLLVFFWLGYHMTQWLLRRFGARWRVPSQNDWAFLIVLAMVLNGFDFVATPIENGFSRHIEHQADVYGQEAIHGLVADPQATAVSAFQRMGEISLDDPDPSPLVEFWLYTHPSVGHRAAFAQSYDPWKPGQHPRYFPK